MAVPVVIAVAALLVTNTIGHGRVALSPYGSVFLLARLQEDGPASAVLKARCPDAGWYLCAFTDRLPMPANDFLWAPDSPVNRDAAGVPRFMGGMLLAPEAGQIVAATLRADPLGVARAMAANMVAQLGSFGIGDTLDNAHFAVAVRPRIEQGFSAHELAAFDQARQARDVLKDAVMPLNLLHLLVVVLALPLLLWSAWRGQGLTLALALFVLAAVLGNALICGGLSAPHPRYGARIMWLLPVAAITQLSLLAPRLSVKRKIMRIFYRAQFLRVFLFLAVSIVLIAVTLLVAVHLFKLTKFITTDIDCKEDNFLYCYLTQFFVVVSPKLREWQDLSAGFLAVGAALLGVFAVIYQTQVTKRLEEETKRRRAEALRRGLLPSVLSNLAEYCEKEAEIIENILKTISQNTYATTPWTNLKNQLSDNEFENPFVEKMLEIIELSDPKHQQNLVTICGNLQIYEARKRMLKRPTLFVSEGNFIDLGVRIAELRARCDKLFPVARTTAFKEVQSLSSDVSISDIQEAVQLLGFSWDDREKLITRIKREFEEKNQTSSSKRH
jgi:hypothetical protein